MVDESRACAALYLKSKKNEQDFIGRFMGPTGRYRPIIVVDQNQIFYWTQFKETQQTRLIYEVLALNKDFPPKPILANNGPIKPGRSAWLSHCFSCFHPVKERK